MVEERIVVRRRWRPALDAQIQFMIKAGRKARISKPRSPWTAECKMCGVTYQTRTWRAAWNWARMHRAIHVVQKSMRAFVDTTGKRSDYALVPGEPGPLLRQQFGLAGEQK